MIKNKKNESLFNIKLLLIMLLGMFAVVLFSIASNLFGNVTLVSFAATDHKFCSDKIQVTTNADDNLTKCVKDDAAETLTITAQGKTSSCITGTTVTPSSITINITNISGNNAAISFNWEATDVATLSIDGATVNDRSGNMTRSLNNGEGVTFTITTGEKDQNDTENKLILSEFNLVDSSSTVTYDVSIDFDNRLGTVCVDDADVSALEVKSVLASGAKFVAIPKDGATFLAWITSDGSVISMESSYTLMPTANMTVKAVFIKTQDIAWFLVDNKYMTNDLNKAGELGNSIVLMNNGTLSEGTYTISKDDTLLIPYDSTNTIITTDMESHASTESAVGAEYRSLSLDSGANIEVYGVICVSSLAARQMVGQVGNYGSIKMDVESNIIIKENAVLYVWGYIFPGESGSGNVTVEAGGTVYEDMMLMDYPGSASTALDIYDAGVFPMRSFTVRNVEVPMVLEHGAKEYVFYCMYMGTLDKNFSDYVLLIGDDSTCPFQLLEGASVTKVYFNGIQSVFINGNANVNTISMKIQQSFLTKTISSSATSGFPIPSGFEIYISNGILTLKDNIVMLEGSKLTIDSTATIDTNGKSLYVFDASDEAGAVSKTDVHGTAYTKVEEDAVLDINGTLKVSGGFYTSTNKASIISSKGTGKIIVEVSLSDSIVKIKTGSNKVSGISASSVNADTGYKVTPAYLKNADGTYIQSRVNPDDGSALTFNYADGRWYNYDIQYQDVDKTADNITHEYLLHGESLTFFNNFVGCHTIPDSELAVADATYYYHKETKSCTVDGEGTTAICDDCGAKLTVEFSTVSTDTTTSNVYKVSGGYFSGNYYVVVSSGPAKYLIETVTANSNDCSFTFDALENIKGLNVEFYNDDFANDLIRLRGYQKNDDGTIRFIGTIDTTGFDMENIATGWPSHNLYGGIKITMTVNGNKLDGIQDVVYTYLYNSEGSFYQFVDSYVFSFSANFGNNTSATIELEFIDKAETPSVVGGTKTTVNVSLAGGEVVITRVENAN